MLNEIKQARKDRSSKCKKHECVRVKWNAKSEDRGHQMTADATPLGQRKYCTSMECVKAWEYRTGVLETRSRMFNEGKGTRCKKRVSDHVGDKTGSYVKILRFDGSYITKAVKSRKTF